MHVTANEPGTTRRRWVSYLLGTSFVAVGLSFLYPVLRYLVPPVASEPSLSEFELDVKASDIAAQLGPDRPLRRKAGAPLPDGGRGAPGADGHVHAPGLHGPVPARSARDIWCACHNGVYDLKGRTSPGPPPRPLTPLEVNVRGDKIVLKRA